jgi:trehalose 6-phosphate synthase
VVVDGIEVTFVALPEAIRRAAVGVIANQTLWFVNHNLYDAARRPILDAHWHAAWDAYREYNRAFAEEIARVAPDGATVVVNDYHLALVGSELARRRRDLSTVLFFHTPFAAPGELRILPRAVRAELLGSMAAFGAVGFHVERWARAFTQCAAAEGLAPTVVAVPLGVDADALVATRATAEVVDRRRALEARLDGRQLIARSDRVELSKNLIRGFLAFEALLEAEPSRRHSVRFVARVYSSRTEQAEYLAYRNEVVRVVDRINDRFGVGDDLPIELDVADDYSGSVALLCASDVLLVNPIRDGMNLVAKEGAILNDRDGTLLLSEEAGAFDELGAHAFAIEPFDLTGTARAMARALDDPSPVRAHRAAQLRSVAAGLDPHAWLERVVTHARVPAQ